MLIKRQGIKHMAIIGYAALFNPTDESKESRVYPDTGI